MRAAPYVLLEEPGSFKRYAINSPALWWNQREILAREAAAQVHRSLAIRVLLSVGEQEGPELFMSFVETLREREMSCSSSRLTSFPGRRTHP